MITIQEALEILKKNIHLMHTEKIPLSSTINRVLAEDIIADIDFPPFNKSAVDGYAFSREDINENLKMVGLVRAGEPPLIKVEKGQCVKIMTGAMLPEGTDSVAMIEHTKDHGSGLISINEKSNIDNICYQGENKKKGNIVLKKGLVIEKRHIGILAACGMHTVEVYNQPLVTVFSTGTELVEPEDVLGNAQIRNSNGPQLLSQLNSMGINALYGGIADDDEVIMEVELCRSIENFDGIIISGGVSVGDYDFVPDILRKMGFEIRFHKLKVKPGKPILFAVKDKKFCFGLPGNPVSSFVQFELLVKPYLYSLMGHEYNPEMVLLEAAEDFSRKNTEFESLIPVKKDVSGKMVKVPYNGSGDVFSLAEAFGLLHFAAGVDLIKKGEMGNVRPI